MMLRRSAARAASLPRQLPAFNSKQMQPVRILNTNRIVGDMGKMLGRLIGENL